MCSRYRERRHPPTQAGARGTWELACSCLAGEQNDIICSADGLGTKCRRSQARYKSGFGGPLVSRSLGGGPETWPSLGFTISSLHVAQVASHHPSVPHLINSELGKLLSPLVICFGSTSNIGSQTRLCLRDLLPLSPGVMFYSGRIPWIRQFSVAQSRARPFPPALR